VISRGAGYNVTAVGGWDWYPPNMYCFMVLITPGDSDVGQSAAGSRSSSRALAADEPKAKRQRVD